MIRLDELKKGFWGYKEESVYRCIARLEEEASQELRRKEEQLHETEKQARKRIRELEQALQKLQAENAVLLEKQRAGSDSPPPSQQPEEESGFNRPKAYDMLKQKPEASLKQRDGHNLSLFQRKPEA